MKDSHVLAFVGEQRAGKGTVAKIYLNLADNPDSPLSEHSFSDIVREMLQQNGTPLGRIVAQQMVTDLFHRRGLNALSNLMEMRIQNDPNQRIILGGVRLFNDCDMLERFPLYHLVYVTAPVELRYKRALKSSEKVDESNISFEEFCRREAHPLERFIPMIGRAFAKHRIINDGTLKDLEGKVQEFYEKIKF